MNCNIYNNHLQKLSLIRPLYFSSYPITVLATVLTHSEQFMVHCRKKFVGLAYYPKIGPIMLSYFSH